MPFSKHRLHTRLRLDYLPDLTPLADIAWLLLVFFLLATRFKAADQHPVDLPIASYQPHGCGPLPAFEVIVQADGRVWVRLSPSLQGILTENLSKTGAKSQLKVTDYNLDFAIAGNARRDPQNVLPQSNERTRKGHLYLVDCVRWVKNIDPKTRFSIRADQNTPYPIIEKVFSAFQLVHVNRFSLVTTLEMEEGAG
jgi:biopolymer transport protein ExbD